MSKRSSMMSKLVMIMLALAVVFAYSVVPANHAFAASSKKPAQVKNLTAKTASSASVTLKWKKAARAKKYEVWVKAAGGKYKAVTKSLKKNTYTVKKLKAGKKYYFKVRAVNGKKKGKFSAVKNATTYPVAGSRQVFVDADYVKALIDSKKSNVVIAEVSWGPDAPEWMIKGAIHVNTDDLESNGQDIGYELWDLRGFNSDYDELIEVLGNYGITKDTELVCYGLGECNSAPTRLAMAALMMGVKNVRVLDGGTAAYGDKGYPMVQKAAKPKAKDFGRISPAHPEWVVTTDELIKGVKDDTLVPVSIRAYDEFIGTNSGYAYIDKAGEPLGAVWGHDTDYGDYFDYKKGKTVDTDVLNEYLAPYGASTNDVLAFYCGTGWRATIPFLICYEEGIDTMRLWDDGWYVYSGAFADSWNWVSGRPHTNINFNDYPVQIGDPAKGPVTETTVKDLDPIYNPLRGLSVKESVVYASGGGAFPNNFEIMPGAKSGINNSVTFTSSDPDVASVDQEGIVTVLQPSATKTVTIKATTNATWEGKPAKTASYKLVINAPVTEKPQTLGKQKTMNMFTKVEMTDTSRYPKGKVVEVWIPVAKTNEYQTIGEPVIYAPDASYAGLNEDSNGNLMAYIKWGRNTDPARRVAIVQYKASRYEVGRDDLQENPNAGFSDEAIAALTEESRFVKVNEEIVKQYAAEAIENEVTTLGKASKIYDWVTANLVRIDDGETIDGNTISVEGCGYGDTVQILSDYEKYGIAGGHCTDINSTFVALCRAAGVPAREMFGIRMNENASGAQHCWAEFYLPGTGWVYADPGDALKSIKEDTRTADGHIDRDKWTEAKASQKFNDNKEKYWAGVDENRIVLSVGRDIVLSPAQKADPRNTFGYPYAEVDGKTLKGDSYRNVDANGKYIDCTKANEFKYTISSVAYISKDALQTKIADQSIKVIDLRRIADFNAGTLDGAVSADMDSYVSNGDKATATNNMSSAIANDPAGTQYALICYTGNKFANAGAEILLDLGVKPENIFILNGGWREWTNK